MIQNDTDVDLLRQLGLHCPVGGNQQPGVNGL